jgi:hypothetical protein
MLIKMLAKTRRISGMHISIAEADEPSAAARSVIEAWPLESATLWTFSLSNDRLWSTLTVVGGEVEKEEECKSC